MVSSYLAGPYKRSCLGFQASLLPGLLLNRGGGTGGGYPVIQLHVIDDQVTASLGAVHQWKTPKLVVADLIKFWLPELVTVTLI